LRKKEDKFDSLQTLNRLAISIRSKLDVFSLKLAKKQGYI